MAHIQFISYATTTAHKNFDEEVNKMEFVSQGSIMQGYVRPYVSELRWKDIRYPKQIEKQLLERAMIWDYAPKSAIAGSPVERVWQLMVRLFRNVTPYKHPVPYTDTTSPIKEPILNVLIGVVEDKQQKVVIFDDVTREAL